MANTIQLKRSSTASDTPSASDLSVGELAVNTADAKLFTKHTDNSIKEIAGSSSGGSVAADDITAGDAAINLTTTSGNITIDAQGSDTDIIFKGTDSSTDITFLTMDGSASAATFETTVVFDPPGGSSAFAASIGETISFYRDVRLVAPGGAGSVDLIFDEGTYTTNLSHTDPASQNQTITLPDATGTVALTSDLGTIASQAANSVNIDGGAIDGVTIGTNSAVTELQVDNLNINGNIISTTDTNGAFAINTNGSGTINLNDTVKLGPFSSSAGGVRTVTTNGVCDLKLDTNSGTDSGSILIEDGANGNISLTPNGTGVVQIDGSNGVSIESGVVAVKNGGTQSEVRLYCESSNAHYAGLKAPAHADFAGNVTSTLPSVTGTLIGTANADAPATTTSSSDADHVLINDGGVLKKITPTNLGIGGGGSSLTIQDEGSALSTAATTLNFVGAGVAATGTGATKTITIGETSNADTVDNKHVSVLSQSAYNALTPDSNTIYFITG